MALENFTQEVVGAYNAFITSLPAAFQSFINLFLLVVLIVVYSIFIWKFHRFIAKKNIFGLNLNQYNKSNHPLFTKIVAGSFYLLEYIIILPFLIFFWFAVFTLFLIFLTNDLAIKTILTLAVTIIAAIRMTSYIPKYGESLAREVAKLLPFTLLAISLLNPGFFDFERVISQLSQIPGLFGQILNFLVFIVVLEILLRFFDFLFSFLGLEDPVETKKSETESEGVDQN